MKASTGQLVKPEQMNSLQCPKCSKPITWQLSGSDIGRDATAVCEGKCPLSFQLVTTQLRVTVSDEYLNPLVTDAKGRLVYPDGPKQTRTPTKSYDRAPIAGLYGSDAPLDVTGSHLQLSPARRRR